jgi:carboxyl-terminal processing protease
VVLGTVVGFATFAWAAGAFAEPVQGDLAPVVPDLEAILDVNLSDEEAEALFEQVRSVLQSRLGSDTVSARDLYLGALLGMLEAANREVQEDAGPLESVLPPSGMLLTRKQADQLARDLDGSMTGLGIQFQYRPENGALVVLGVISGSPSARVGMQRGDWVVEADGQSFQGRSQDQVLSQLQGELGSVVKLSVLRPLGNGSAAQYSAALERSTFDVPSVVEGMTHTGVGHLGLERIHRGSPAEVEAAMARLREQGADRFVLDLRGSQGGCIHAASAIADLFLPEGTVVMRLVEPGVGEQDLTATRGTVAAEAVVVLVDRWTHGAAEALAAALQDHSRAYVIGETTLGTARTETLVDVGAGFWLRLDSVRLETAEGRTWHGTGLSPDAAIEAPPVAVYGNRRLTLEIDPQFQQALHYLESEGGRARVRAQAP